MSACSRLHKWSCNWCLINDGDRDKWPDKGVVGRGFELRRKPENAWCTQKACEHKNVRGTRACPAKQVPPTLFYNRYCSSCLSSCDSSRRRTMSLLAKWFSMVDVAITYPGSRAILASELEGLKSRKKVGGGRSQEHIRSTSSRQCAEESATLKPRSRAWQCLVELRNADDGNPVAWQLVCSCDVIAS